ncbi:ninjurin-A-like [Zophobas morio]|uniref:ninjurin-A-like n=1 Tax=Zophobas morio TaxID=2755281 RepID=UPI003082C674
MASHHNNYSSLIESNSPSPPSRIRRENVTPNMAEKVPLVEVIDNEKPPLATAETDDDSNDDREVVSAPYPGVDDGFFNENGDKKSEDGDKKSEDGDNPDSEDFPKYDGDIPIIITSRAGGDGDSEKPDEVDGMPKGLHPGYPGRFPYAPGFGGVDIETGSVIPDLESIPDVNIYQHKKTLAQGMMDLALFSANANQLRYVLESFNRHPYYYPSLVLISFSLLCQVAVGIGLVWNATYNVKNEKEICIANKINNFTVIGIFLVTVINVFISAFGVANAAPVA